ncbi:EAL domain-containing protein [Xylophilus sp. GW821-FHT01B05]
MAPSASFSPTVPVAQGRGGKRAWAWFAIGFAGLGLLAVHTLYLDRLRVAAQEQDRLEVQARIIDETLTQQIDAVHAVLLAVRDEWAQVRGAEEGAAAVLLTRRLQAMVDIVPSVRSILAADSHGKVHASNRPEALGQLVAESPFFLAARNGGSARVLHASAAEPDAPQGSLALTHRMQDTAGGFAGIVSAAIDPDYVSALLRSTAYAPDMLATVGYGTGAQAQGFVDSGTSGSAHRVDGPPPERLATSRTVLGPAAAALDRPLVVSVSRDGGEVFRIWRQRVGMYVALYLTLLVGGAMLLLLVQRRQRVLHELAYQREAERLAYVERLDFMLTGADVGLWDWNVSAQRIDFSDRWHALLGLAPGEYSENDEAWHALVHPDDLPSLRAGLAGHHQGGASLHEIEYRMRHKSGRWIWVLDRAKVMRRDRNGAPLRIVGAHMDVTQRKHADEALRQSEARFRSLTELSSDWYWELDEQHRFVRFEGYSGTEIGLPQEDNIGLTRWDLGALNMTEADWQRHRAVLDAHQTFHDLELQRLDGSGSVYWVSISGTPIFDTQGVFRGYRGIGRSITERKRVEDEIERLAFYDALTGLPNRRLLLDRLILALAQCRVQQQRGALLFIDLDNFKDLNDTMGHDVGDSLLERVANRLVTCVKGGDTVARLGGDEFVVMLEGLAQDEAGATGQARLVGERILALLNNPYQLEGYQHHSTPSLGVALFDGSVESVDDLLKRADLAMYEAKAAGRNTMCFFHPNMQEAVSARSVLEADLRHAINNRELLLYYQPVVDHEGRLTGVEALVRWRHPRRGMVSPGEFIPLAEQTGLILQLGHWVLTTACEQLVQWQAQPETDGLAIAVNVSARQFRQLDFVQRVLDVLKETGARGDRLKIELTETLLLNDVEDIIAKMAALKAHGVGFSLDDFGTGYSSLSYLKRLPLDTLKIDQSFVRDVLTDPNDAAIVRTILALAESLDLAVVAEGVETQGQLDFLNRNGCRAFQGYLFGRPAPMQVMLAQLVPNALAQPNR